MKHNPAKHNPAKHIPDRRRSRTLRQALFALSVCLFVFGFIRSATAQNRNAGEIRGTVQDTSGGVVPGASVDAKNTATGQVTHGTTNADGLYDLPFVPPGPYSITFTKNGYATSTANNITLQVEAITVNAKLQVGAVATQVQVNASNGALLQTESAEIKLTLSPAQLTNLPNVGGDWKTMTELLPGVATGRYEVGTGGGLASTYYVAINGAQSAQSNLLTDGGVTVDLRSADPWTMEPPLDAIAEVNFNTGVFDAKSGNGTSTMNVITKGGTNRFHGAVWERIQNDAFQATPYNQPSKPALRWNQYGFAIGGPFIKNKLFFFASMQRNPQKLGVSGFYTVPEDAVRGIGTPNGDAVFDPSIYGIIYDPATEQVVNGVKVRQPFPNNTIPHGRLNPIAQNIMQYYPRANEPFTNGNNYNFVTSAPQNIILYNWRMDYDVSSSNRISASGGYAQNPYTNPVPANPSGYFDYQQQSNQIVSQITDAWTLSPSLLNEARFSVLHTDQTWTTADTGVAAKLGLPNLADDVFPHTYITGGARSPFNPLNGDLFALTRDNGYAASDSLTWTLGKHSLEFGGEWDKGTDDDAWDQVSSGNFNFSGVATLNPNISVATGSANPTGGSGIADFLLGDVDSFSNTLPIIPRVTMWDLQAYAQDAYKVLPNLTVNLGVRMLYQGGMKESQGRFANFEPNLANPATGTPGAVAFGTQTLGHAMEESKWFFQPRLGFSYNFKPTWTVRGGFGLYNIPWTANNYAENAGVGYSAFGQAVAPTNSYEPAFQLQNGPPSLTYPSAATRTPDSLNGSGVNYQPYDTPISYLTEYQFDIQHQIGGYLIDVAYVGTKGSNIAFTSDYTQIPRSQLGATTHPFPQFNNVNYWLLNGASNYNALQIQTKKRFNNGFVYQASYTYAKNLDTGTGQGGIGAGAIENYQDSYNPMANYGPSINDLRHTFNGSVVYELPFGRNKRFLNQGAFVNELIGGWQVSSTFQAHSGTPITPVVGSADLSGRYSGGSWFPNRIGSGKSANPTLARWYNVDDYAIPAPNTLGNAGRDTVFGPHFTQVDLSAAKKFRIPKAPEGTYFEFKADAYNALNHPNWGQPGTGVYGSDAANTAAGAGAITSFFPMRNLQLGGTIRF